MVDENLIDHDEKSAVVIERSSAVTVQPVFEDVVGDNIVNLRPSSFEEYPGQTRVKQNLQVYVRASIARGEPLDHVLLHGPPGLGKTTLSRILAKELGVQFIQTSGPSIDKQGDLAGILAGMDVNGLLFIDEIHRLPRVVEEVLYSAMEDFSVDILIGQGPAARTVSMPINPFTLVGATTRVASLSRPLVGRFGIQERLEYYDEDSLASILLRSARIWKMDLDSDGARELGKRSRGTPRIANRLLRRARDFAEFNDTNEISAEIISHTLERLDIDRVGLDHMDRKILEIIRDRYQGGPVGIDTLAATVGEEKATIEEVYEPYLVHTGLVSRGPRGRELTEKGYMHLKGGVA